MYNIQPNFTNNCNDKKKKKKENYTTEVRISHMQNIKIPMPIETVKQNQTEKKKIKHFFFQIHLQISEPLKKITACSVNTTAICTTLNTLLVWSPYWHSICVLSVWGSSRLYVCVSLRLISLPRTNLFSWANSTWNYSHSRHIWRINCNYFNVVLIFHQVLNNHSRWVFQLM